jgi:hypothetical protein
MRYCDGTQRERSIVPWNSHAIELGDAVIGMPAVVVTLTGPTTTRLRYP